MFEETESGARAEGMAGAFVAVADDLSAVDFNPAGLYHLKTRSFAGTFKLLYGGVGVGLHTGSASVGLPLGRLGVVAVRMQETGFELQAQRSLKVGHGFLLAEGMALGLGVTIYNLHQREYGDGYAVGLDVGMFSRVYRYWTVGFGARNLNMPRIGSSGLPRLLSFGLGYSPKPGVQSAIDISKEPGRPTRLNVGQELRIIQDRLTVRAGVQTEPVRICFGVRAGTERLHLDYALVSHPVLPFTHGFGVTFDF